MVVSLDTWLIVHRSIALLVFLAACGGGGAEPPTITTGPGAESPEDAVRELRGHLAAGDFASASALALPDQAALASLAEGATFSDVADAVETGDARVAANFWSGFAQGAGEVFSRGAAIGTSETMTESGVEFQMVGVTPTGGTERIVVTQDVEGFRVDLFASFSAGIAGRLITPVEMLLSSSTEDAGVILESLSGVVPSLLVAASDPTLTPEAVQEILQLIELITRV